MKIEVIRTSDNGKLTEGVLYVHENNSIVFECKTLELPWKNNERRVSCIPAGTYPIKKHRSPKFGNSFWIKDVPNRSEILIHPANYVRQLLGCIAVGEKHADIDKDGLIDVTNSKKTMEKLLKYEASSITIRYRS
jgi:hypothetical protein